MFAEPGPELPGNGKEVVTLGDSPIWGTEADGPAA